MFNNIPYLTALKSYGNNIPGKAGVKPAVYQNHSYETILSTPQYQRSQ